MDEREKLIQQLDVSRTATHKLIEQIDSERETYPGWTLRHFLAHLTGWDEAVTQSLRAHATGRIPATPAIRGLDFYNEQSVAERVDLNYRQVLVECEMAREALKAAVRSFPLERWADPVVSAWGTTMKPAGMVWVMIHHEHEHVIDICEKLGLEKPEFPTETT